MPSLLLLPGFPNTNGPAQEGLGKGIDTVTGFVVTGDGFVGTPAQVRTLAEAAIAGNGPHTLVGIYRPPNQI